MTKRFVLALLVATLLALTIARVDAFKWRCKDQRWVCWAIGWCDC